MIKKYKPGPAARAEIKQMGEHAWFEAGRHSMREELEARLAWQAEMLERAKETFNTESKCGNPESTKWLADLEKGPPP